MSVAGIVLAAGRGSRMGGPKALVEFEGVSFLGRVVKSMRRGGVGPITVVVAQGMEDVAEESRAAGADVVVNPRPERGQLSSFEVGVGGLGSGCYCSSAHLLPVEASSGSGQSSYLGRRACGAR